MSEIEFKPVFQNITSIVKDQGFSVMYFGRHCGKNLLILVHDFTLMITFDDNTYMSTAKWVKTVSFRENSAKGIHIVGKEEIILLLDELGNLWRLINGFETSAEQHECLHSLEEKCFYEWIPFKKFNFVKVLAISTIKDGFACLGLTKNSERRLLVLPSMNSALENYTFEELGKVDSFNFFLVSLNLNTQKSVLKNELFSEEMLLVTNRENGKTYLCTKNEKYCLIDQSNIFLISALHFFREECILLCYKNGKIIFFFYNESEMCPVVFLPKKLLIIEKCCCFDFCFLWSDGTDLHHTKIEIQGSKKVVRASHLKLTCSVESPLSMLKINQHILIVSANNIYYLLSAGSSQGTEIKVSSKELLSKISSWSQNAETLQSEIDTLSDYLLCKSIIQSNNIKKNIEMRLEKDHLIIKSFLSFCLKRDIWKVRLKAQIYGKEFVHLVDLEHDVSQGMLITVENPFKKEVRMKVSLVGNFEETALFLDFGEAGQCENDSGKNHISETLFEILKKRNLS